MKKSISRFKKRILAMSIAGFCLISALCVTVGAISFYNNSKLTIYYHYIPILNDSAVGIPGCPSGTYDYNTLYTYTTVTAYNGSDSVTAC